MKKSFLIGFIACAAVLVVLGATYQNIFVTTPSANTTQFGVSNGVVTLRSGIPLTNLVLYGHIVGGGTNDLGSPGSRFHDIWLGHNADVLGTLFVAGEVTLSNPGNSHALWTDSNGKVKGYLFGSGLAFDGTTLSATGGSAGSTQFYDFQITTNSYNIHGKGNTLIISNYVQFPYSTLTLTGTNASAMDLSSSSAFRLLLSDNAYIDTPTGFPTTNFLQTIQLFVQQNASAIKTLTWNTNAFKFPDETPPTQSTNANAVNVYTFVTHPFSNNVLISIQTARYQ